MALFSKASADSLIRIDKSMVEEIIPFSHKYELIIEDNCSFCLNQLSILKDCVDEKDVIVLMDNRSKLSEEKLQRIIKRKKISFKTYILSEELKKTYEFKTITPMMWINKLEEKKSYTGVVSCKQLKS
ncbi:MAG: hypothetical protein HOP07_13460 [Bacteriovoracaceae bacterium]|nr:hypothetical protein [Bacteriovoracaceae bacterium]